MRLLQAAAETPEPFRLIDLTQRPSIHDTGWDRLLGLDCIRLVDRMKRTARLTYRGRMALANWFLPEQPPCPSVPVEIRSRATTTVAGVIASEEQERRHAAIARSRGLN